MTAQELSHELDLALKKQYGKEGHKFGKSNRGFKKWLKRKSFLDFFNPKPSNEKSVNKRGIFWIVK